MSLDNWEILAVFQEALTAKIMMKGPIGLEILLEMTTTDLTFSLLSVGQDFCPFFFFNFLFLPEVAALDMCPMRISCLQHCVNIYFTEP